MYTQENNDCHWTFLLYICGLAFGTGVLFSTTLSDPFMLFNLAQTLAYAGATFVGVLLGSKVFKKADIKWASGLAVPTAVFLNVAGWVGYG